MPNFIIAPNPWHPYIPDCNPVEYEILAMLQEQIYHHHGSCARCRWAETKSDWLPVKHSLAIYAEGTSYGQKQFEHFTWYITITLYCWSIRFHTTCGEPCWRSSMSLNQNNNRAMWRIWKWLCRLYLAWFAWWNIPQICSLRKPRTATIFTFINKLSRQVIDIDNLSGQLIEVDKLSEQLIDVDKLSGQINVYKYCCPDNL